MFSKNIKMLFLDFRNGLIKLDLILINISDYMLSFFYSAIIKEKKTLMYSLAKFSKEIFRILKLHISDTCFIIFTFMFKICVMLKFSIIAHNTYDFFFKYSVLNF